MYKNILVPIDGSPTAQRGLNEAITLARTLGARLTLLFVLDAFPLRVDVTSAYSFEPVRESMKQFGENVLAKARRLATDQGVNADALLRETAQGRVADVVLDQVRELHSDLIVMGTHGRRGFSHLVLGSDAELVVRGSVVPVLLVRGLDPN